MGVWVAVLRHGSSTAHLSVQWMSLTQAGVFQGLSVYMQCLLTHGSGVGIMHGGIPVTGGEDGHVRLWDISTATPIVDLDCHQPCRALQFMQQTGERVRQGRDGGRAASADEVVGRDAVNSWASVRVAATHMCA